PHGGVLKDLVAHDAAIKDDLLKEVPSLVNLNLTARQLCDLELILNGGFSPLDGFLNQDDYESVVDTTRLKSGILWPIPITLDLSKETVDTLKVGQRIALIDFRDLKPLAILTIESVYQPDKQKEAQNVFRGDPEHPAIKYLFETAGDYYVGGSLQGIQFPIHYDYTNIRKNPTQLRLEFTSNHWNKVVAFQTRNPMHLSHHQLTLRAGKDLNSKILIHPVVGLTKPGDIDHFTRAKVYNEIVKKYPPGIVSLSLLPLAMRMGGDKEALWHAIIRKNYGATHFIVGRDHAGPGKNSKGVDFYGPYDAQVLLEKYVDEIGITIVPFRMVTYLPDKDRYAPIDEIDLKTTKTWNISGTDLRNKLKNGDPIPEWFTYPEIAKILQNRYPKKTLQSFILYLKSSKPNEAFNAVALSNALQSTFNQFENNRHVTVLD
ncbi:sulfate adenylyltransferase, partial [Ascoidea rubescens DSM 1968]